MSKKFISLKKAHEILSNCSAIVVDDDALVYPALDDEIKNEKSNAFLTYILDEYEYAFNEGDNQEVEICDFYMFLRDTEGKTVRLTILIPQKLD